MKTSGVLLPPGYKPDVVKSAASMVESGYVSPEEISDASREMLAAQRVVRMMLPMEGDAKAQALVIQNGAVRRCAKLIRQQKIYEFSEGEYMLQDLTPLRYRNESGFPRLAVFRPGVAESGFEARLVDGATRVSPGDDFVVFDADNLIQAMTGKLRVTMVPKVPVEIGECYKDVIFSVRQFAEARLKGETGRRRVVESFKVDLKTRFGGVIPEDVKLELHRAYTSGLFKEFFIVAEVEIWQWDVQVVSRQGDPLLLGYDGFQYWLIKAFDTTTLERLMAEEFAVKVH